MMICDSCEKKIVGDGFTVALVDIAGDIYSGPMLEVIPGISNTLGDQWNLHGCSSKCAGKLVALRAAQDLEGK